MKLLCKIGLHKKTMKVKHISSSISNITEYCEWCGKVFDEYGMSHFHIGTFRLK